jgi:hypothetical protein
MIVLTISGVGMGWWNWLKGVCASFYLEQGAM